MSEHCEPRSSPRARLQGRPLTGSHPTRQPAAWLFGLAPSTAYTLERRPSVREEAAKPRRHLGVQGSHLCRKQCWEPNHSPKAEDQFSQHGLKLSRMDSSDLLNITGGLLVKLRLILPPTSRCRPMTTQDKSIRRVVIPYLSVVMNHLYLGATSRAMSLPLFSMPY